MSISVVPVRSRRERRDFMELPRRLFQDTPQWVPFLVSDYRRLFRRAHPFLDHAEVEFYLVYRETVAVARVMMIHNERYNRHHGTRAAHFYFCDFTDDEAVVDTLFTTMEEWARRRELTALMGPLFMGATLGGGVLVDGFQHTAAMTMMPYNHPYYPGHYERRGFQKRFDLLSLFIDPATFRVPPRVERLAEHVRRRGRIKVVEFRSKRELRRIATRVAELYNPTLAIHEENYPLTEDELRYLIKELLVIARPHLEKVITYDDRIVGYLFGFPDLSPALQRNGGRLTPAGILRLLGEMRRPGRLILNGMGILEEYRNIGGNALLYSELARTAGNSPEANVRIAEIVQVNEHTDLMLSDLRTLGAEVAKTHRVYTRDLPRNH